jgi:hypothetical protein
MSAPSFSHGVLSFYCIVLWVQFNQNTFLYLKANTWNLRQFRFACPEGGSKASLAITHPVEVPQLSKTVADEGFIRHPQRVFSKNTLALPVVQQKQFQHFPGQVVQIGVLWQTQPSLLRLPQPMWTATH